MTGERLVGWATAATVAGALAVIVAATPANAVDETKPTACNGLAYTDPIGDISPTQVVTSDALDVTGAFVKFDPSKGDEATTYNVVVKDLDTAVPAGATTMSWTAYYNVDPISPRFVRTTVDFGGGAATEYGSFRPNPVQVTVNGFLLHGITLVEGTTPGKLFPGPDGVVQMVIPATEARNKTSLLYMSAFTRTDVAPTDVVGPHTSVHDIAPDQGPEGNAKATVSPCPAVAPPGIGPTTRTLPVKLLTTSVRARKVKKSLALKLRSSAAVSSLAAQLRKGKRLVGKGSMKSLDGTRTLKLKLSRKLGKGSYMLDLAGNDASGARLLRTAKLRVR